MEAKATPSGDEQEGRGPRVFVHGRGDDEEFAGEYAEWRHAQYGHRTQHKSPADGGIGPDQSADAVHRLGARLLRGVADGEEDRGLGQRMHGHVQQPGEARHCAAHAEGER